MRVPSGGGSHEQEHHQGPPHQGHKEVLLPSRSGRSPVHQASPGAADVQGDVISLRRGVTALGSTIYLPYRLNVTWVVSWFCRYGLSRCTFLELGVCTFL